MRVKTSKGGSIIFICFWIGLGIHACTGSGESKQDTVTPVEDISTSNQDIAINDIPRPIPMISFSPTSSTLRQGDIFTQTVEVRDIQSIFSIAFDLIYDPSIIEFISADEGTFLNPEGLDLTFFLTALEDNQQGKLLVGLTRLGKISDVSGSGRMLTLTFRAAGIGTTNLIFANPKEAKSNAEEDVIIQIWGDANISVE